MSTIMQNLSEAQLAAIAAIVNGEAAGKVDPASEPAKPVSKKTGFILIRALGHEVPDDEIVPTKVGSNEPALWADGTPVTFGDLRFAVEDGATRADGTKCRDYPNVWLLSQDAAYAAIKIANSAKPKKREAFKPKASPKATPAKPDAEGIEVLVQREIARALAGLQAEPAKPVKSEPAKPVKPEPAKPVYQPGDVIRVMVNGEAVELQITEDAKRLRKTVV